MKLTIIVVQRDLTVKTRVLTIKKARFQAWASNGRDCEIILTKHPMPKPSKRKK